MTTSYPIVAQYELGDPVKRGPLGLLKRRESDEIPKIKPHEVLVYRIGGKFVVDQRQLRTHDDMVVQASSVSVVSVRRGTEVEVSFPIDSRDASKFTVKVTFVCSVLDPVVVVRDGQVDAADALLAYLKTYQDLFNLGLKHPISEVNDVRTEAALQVKAYLALRPPGISGMDIALANVQVETPAVLADLGQLANEQLIELQKTQSRALLDARQLANEQLIELQKTQSRVLLDASWQSHILEKTAKLGEAVGDDPTRALHLAHADGGLTSHEYAERVQQLDEVRQQREQAEHLAATAREIAVEDRDVQWAREDRRAEVEWQRGQLEIERREALQRRRDEMEANIKLLQMFAERGHLDTHYEDIGDLIKRIRGEAAEVAGSRIALPQGEEHQPDEPKDDNGD